MNHATIPAIPLIIPILLFLLDAVMIITVIFVDNKKAVNTLAWVTTILLLPVIGIVFYFIFGSKMRFKKEKAFKAKKIEDETIYHSFIHQLFHLEKETIIFNDPDIKNYQDMIRMNLTYGKSIYTQDNKIEIFTKGEDKFRSLFEDIKNASSSIHMTYYIFRHDTLGEELIRILTEKALQGVEVRLIYDDVGCKLTRKKIFQPLLKAGGQVYSFLPSILLFNLRANYRNHRKMVIIDGQIGYLGGMNIGLEYLSSGKGRTKPWRDTHIRMEGSSVDMLQSRFLMDWAYAGNEDIGVEERFFPPLTKHPGNLGVQIVASGPDNESEQIKNAYIKMINSAKKSLLIQSPYFIPDDALLESLRIAALSGVQVSIMLPGKYDKFIVYCAGMSYIRNLIDYGVNFYLYNGFIHAKMLVMDENITSIGTANIDIRSFLLDFEINAFIYNQDFSRQCIDIFREDIRNSYHLTKEDYQKRPRSQKIMESLAKLFSPLF